MAVVPPFNGSSYDSIAPADNMMIIKEILPYSTSVNLKKNQELNLKEESSRAIYYIETGSMDVSYTLHGTKVIVTLLGAADFFGEIGFFDGISRVRTITANEETVIKMFPKLQIERMQSEDPELYGRFITFITKSICKKFRRVLEDAEPLKAYAASLSTGSHQFVESQELPADFFKMKEGRQSNQFLEELKARLFNISLKLQQDFSDAVPDEIKAEFNTAMDCFFDSLEGFNETLENSVYKDEVWGYLFKETFPYFMRSRLTERAYFKPNGYAGDFKTIEMMYENKPSGDGKMGQLVDAWLLNRPPCRAVRGRRNYLAGKLHEVSKKTLEIKKNVNIMSLACGPSRELFDLIKSFDQDDRINAICLDIDPEALQFTDEISKSFSHRAHVGFMKDNLIKWALGTSTHRLEQQDVIYSGGLFDYLDDSLFLMLANRCYEFLNPGGTLIIGNFRPNPDRIFMDHMLEWRLIYRENEDLLKLFEKSLFTKKVEIQAEEEAGIQLFAIATKD